MELTVDGHETTLDVPAWFPQTAGLEAADGD
jgi:hypothetical protein